MTATNLCENCSLCCKLLGVQIIDKAPHTWCRYHAKGVGCTIHGQTDFPTDCQTYVCLWRQMKDEGRAFDETLRPDRCKVIIDAAKDEQAHYVRCDPGYPAAWRQPKVQAVLAALAAAGSTIYLVTENQRKPLRVVAAQTARKKISAS